MKDYRSLSHTKWDCKYHVVFIPKYRRKRIFGKLRGHLGEICMSWRSRNKAESLRDTSGRIRSCASASRQNSRRASWALSKARAPSQSHAFGGGTSPGKVFGRGGTSTVGLDEVVVRARNRHWNSSTSIGRARSRISKTAPSLAPLRGSQKISPRLCRG